MPIEEDRGASAYVFQILVQRQAALAAARTRITWIFVGASLASAFLVGQVLPFGALTLAGIACYAAIGMAAVLALASEGSRRTILRPRTNEEGASVEDPSPVWSKELSALESRLARVEFLGQVSVVLLVVEILAAGINASRIS